MAPYTMKLIMSAFQEMLEEMPFDKVTVASLVRRAGISPNTFYYHYQDIYALLDAWFREKVAQFVPGDTPIEWKSATKAMLRQCRAHPKTVYHVFDAPSRDRLERYIFSLTDDVFWRVTAQAAEGRAVFLGNAPRYSSPSSLRPATSPNGRGKGCPANQMIKNRHSG